MVLQAVIGLSDTLSFARTYARAVLSSAFKKEEIKEEYAFSSPFKHHDDYFRALDEAIEQIDKKSFSLWNNSGNLGLWHYPFDPHKEIDRINIRGRKNVSLLAQIISITPEISQDISERIAHKIPEKGLEMKLFVDDSKRVDVARKIGNYLSSRYNTSCKFYDRNDNPINQ